jgi:predicted DsbA family dithiol-disulfide isomerase
MTERGKDDVLQVEIWSDVVCPWCYIGKRRIESALAGFEHADDVEVVYRSFQLDPAAEPFDPAAPPEDLPTRLGRKYGGDRAAGLGMISNVTQVAAGDGLAYDLEHAQGGSTLDAHRLLHAALVDGGPTLQAALKEEIMKAYFTQARNISDPAVLVDLAVTVGLDEQRVRDVLGSDAYRDDVMADQAQAQAFGANGVPFFVIDRRYGVSGAQPAAVLAQALTQAWADRAAVTP